VPKQDQTGCPSLPDFTDDFIGKDFTGPWTDTRNNFLESINAIKNSISCHFNENATRDLVPQRLPMTAGFTKDIFRTPQFTGRRWSPLLALRRTFQDSTNDGTTIESTAGFTKDMSGHHK